MHLSMAELLRVRDNRLSSLAEDRSRSLRVLRAHIAGCPACADALAELRASAAPPNRQLDAAEAPHLSSAPTPDSEAATLAELLSKRAARPELRIPDMAEARPLPVRRLVLVSVLLVVAAVVGNYFRG